MVGRRIAILATCLMAVVGLVASCQGATQVVIEARTNVAYRSGLVTSFTVGKPDSIEGAASTTETNEPWGADGFIGSLVSVPGGEKDELLAVKLVMGVRREARDCLPPKYEGCIVARRKLRYLPHERLLLPIALYAQCEGVPCDQDSTCNALGQCVPSAIDPNACTAPDGCTIPGDLPPNTVTPDGSPPPNDATADATSDSPAPSDDASTDAANEAASDGGVQTVNRIDCPGSDAGACNRLANEVCCFNATTKLGTCTNNCTPDGQFELQGQKQIPCDDHSDCQNNYWCCRPPGAPVTTCVPQPCNGYAPVCHGSGECPSGKTCTGTAFGYYRTCQ